MAEDNDNNSHSNSGNDDREWRFANTPLLNRSSPTASAMIVVPRSPF